MSVTEMIKPLGPLLSAAADAGNTAGTIPIDAADVGGNMFSTIIMLVIMVGAFYFLLIRPEKKRSAQLRDMINNLQIADEIVTTGGIIGRVISVKDDTVLIETGSDRTRLRILKSAIAENRGIDGNGNKPADKAETKTENKDASKGTHTEIPKESVKSENTKQESNKKSKK
jgi:preprotein translocase subunit YajC